MTAADRREFLTSRGYWVATTSFPGAGGLPLWCMTLPDPASVRRVHPRPPWWMGFIDLQSGQWRPWETDVWREFDFGPWHELAAESSETSETSELPAWIRQCIEAGFECERELDPGANIYWLTRAGRRYLAYPAACRISDMDRSYSLDEFTARRAEPPRLVKQPVMVAGRNRQSSLFS